MSKIVPLRLVEEDEDAGLVNEVGDSYPLFQFQRFGSANGSHIYLVHAGQEFIGSLSLRHDPLSGSEKWSIAFIESQKRHTHIPVASKEEGAQLLWQDRMGIIQLPNNPPYYEPLGEVPDDPDHYESIKAKAKSLVSVLAEDGEEDEAFDDPKEVSYGQLENIISDLQAAGFKILNHEDSNGTLTFSFSWPRPTASQYINGWKRAREIIEMYMPLRMENYKIRTEQIEGVPHSVAQITKRAEDDPHIWKVTQDPKAKEFGTAWFQIFYNGRLVGRAYMPSFNAPEENGEHLREELSHLNEIVPFDPRDWPETGNSWARGPAINWWRAHRDKIPNVSKYAFSKDLLIGNFGESYGISHRTKTF